mmetsp:Transcript_4812/g.10450  ORF Transcript_4812/g.10450 Transcript_4812/m.10450 type:complete len:260 (-) Transcript_4812:286-1065(-)
MGAIGRFAPRARRHRLIHPRKYRLHARRRRRRGRESPRQAGSLIRAFLHARCVDAHANGFSETRPSPRPFDGCEFSCTRVPRLCSRIPDEVLLMFYQNGTFQKPQHKWGGRKPHMAILFDDVMGSLLFTKGIRKLNKLTIFHRHLGQLKEGGALGCSLYFLVQSYKAQAGGISKCIRNQATTIVLFKTKNDKELQEVQEECSGEIDKETFYQMYEQATDGEHNALVIDLHWKKDTHPSGFRKNLDTFLIPEQFSQPDSK